MSRESREFWTLVVLVAGFTIVTLGMCAVEVFGDPGPWLHPDDRSLLRDVPECLAGPLVVWPSYCDCFDLDANGDNHVDLRDVAAWQREWVDRAVDLPPFMFHCNTWRSDQPDANTRRLAWFRRWGDRLLKGPGVYVEAGFALTLYDCDADEDIDLRDYARLQHAAGLERTG